MNPIRLLSASAQVAAHLRTELERRRWSDGMPGVNWLATELGVNRKTVIAALQQLEKEGLLAGQGQGRKRRILPPAGKTVRPMRIALLKYDPLTHLHEFVAELHHQLMAAGFTAFYSEKSVVELGTDGERLGRLVRQTEADAWVILGGSREVLEWFCAQSLPAFAMFGRREGLPIAAAGPNTLQAFAVATRQLIGSGHRRIVMLTRSDRRLPEPGLSERVVLDELQAHGIPVGDYNLPHWDETPEGLQALLSSLFRVTPPTALMVDSAPLFAAVQQFLAGRGIRVPQQLSLLCSDDDPTFAWCQPTVAAIRWDSGPVVRRVVAWTANVSQGKKDVRQTLTKAEFVAGGTIGPVPHP